MDSGAPEKKPVRLSVYNQSFSLLVSGDPAEIESAAQEVDELMTAIARTGNLDSTRIAVLACLHLQDRVRSLERELAAYKHRVDDRTRRLSGLLDQIIEAE
ncbi:MAG: cell division protein ZapA [Acidobacteria bacterium]|nr:cell division protein ZapA [Acidobacteriota bacterium]MBI3279590.1 cell division protein ZapA [Acidobacteriota bacterium]